MYKKFMFYVCYVWSDVWFDKTGRSLKSAPSWLLSEQLVHKYPSRVAMLERLQTLYFQEWIWDRQGARRRKYALYIIAPTMQTPHSPLALAKCVPITSVQATHWRWKKWQKRSITKDFTGFSSQKSWDCPQTKHYSSVISGPSTNQHPYHIII